MSQTNREIVEAYFAAYPADWERMRQLRHADFVEEWPQSGERIEGHENYRAIHEHYPGGTPSTEIREIVGSEDRWVTTPFFTPLRIVGAGEVYTVEARVGYPDGTSSLLVTIVELQDAKVRHQRTYFAGPFEPAAWRAQWVARSKSQGA